MKISPHHPFKSEQAKATFLALYDAQAREWPVACEPLTVNTSFGPTFVRVSGPSGAPPLVLLPGMNASSLMWLPNIAALSEHYRAYAVDAIYDVGKSVYIRPLKRVDDLVTWLDELFDALELEGKVNLMGMSYGGWLSSQYALRFPERLAKLVLVAPAATVFPLRRMFLLRLALALIPLRYFSKSAMYWLFEDMVRKDKAAVDKAIEEAFIATRCYKSKQLVAPSVLKDEELASLPAPVLYLVGENEKIYSASQAVQRLKRVAPQVQTEVIPDAGHDLTLVQADLVNGKALEFLGQS